MRKILSCLLILYLFLLQTNIAVATDTIEIAVNQSRLLAFNGVYRVAVANPDIADVGVVSGSEILVVGKQPGLTNVHIWSSSGRQSYLIEVGTDDSNIANMIKNTLGYTNIRVSKVNKTVILEGSVNDQYQKARAEQVAGAYGEKVVNLLEITNPIQVKIEAKIVEINREKIKDTGIIWGNNPDSSPGTFYAGQSFINSVVGSVFGDMGSFADINSRLNALVKNGSAKILSQPNIITLSGDKANIMIGGEIPVPVALEDNKITVEWREYGIKLDIAPEVNTEGLIKSKIKAEVSTLDWNSTHRIELGQNMRIPPIKVRKAESAITLNSGQTMAIGGLIANEISEDIHKIPLLADLPVIGKLFKSRSFSKAETELVIFITPTIVNPTEYKPNTTRDMKDYSAENPWGGENSGRKN
jgi:pilus assembly protein CpaC